MVTINNVNLFKNVNPEIYKKIELEDGGRSGTFTYDSSRKDENDGGVCFNGWVRDGIDKIFGEWFGVIPNDKSAHITNSNNLDLLKTYCNNNDATGTLGPGKYYISRTFVINFNFIASGAYKTIFYQIFPELDVSNYNDYNDMLNQQVVSTPYKAYGQQLVLFNYLTPKLSIIEVVADKNIHVGNFTIKADQHAYSTSADMNSGILPVIGLRAGNFDNDHNVTGHFNRSLMENITVHSCYQLFYLSGWVSGYKRLFGTYAKIGLRAYEFNNNDVDIKMESVEQPLDLHELNSVQFYSFLSEGSTDMKPCEFSRLRSVTFNGFYTEGSYNTNSPVINVGLRTMDENLTNYWYYRSCKDLSILDISSAQRAANVSVPYIDVDYVNGLTINTYDKYIKRNLIRYTPRSRNIKNNSAMYESTFHTIQDNINTLSAPNIINPNPFFKYGLSGYRDYNTNVDITYVNEDNGVKSLTKNTMIKITQIDTSETSQFSPYLWYGDDDLKSIFKPGDTLAVYAWIYIPSTPELENGDSVFRAVFHVSDLNDNASYSGERIDKIQYDKWSLLRLYIENIPDYIKLVNPKFRIENVNSVTNPQTFYIDSLFITNNVATEYMLINGNYNLNNSPIAIDNGEYQKYLVTPPVTTRFKSVMGDRINNPNYDKNTINGEAEFLICKTDGDTVDNWEPLTPPLLLPTTNQGAGTWFLDNGVITAGS